MTIIIRVIIGLILVALIITTVIVIPGTEIHGLMTKEKLEKLLKERGELIGKPYEPPTKKLEGLPWTIKQGLTQSEKLKELQAEKKAEEQFMKELEGKPKEYMTYEEALLEIVNRYEGTNYTSIKEMGLGELERAYQAQEYYEFFGEYPLH